jgi:hypothetical protein
MYEIVINGNICEVSKETYEEHFYTLAVDKASQILDMRCIPNLEFKLFFIYCQNSGADAIDILRNVLDMKELYEEENK